jgi:hypothetical protein
MKNLSKISNTFKYQNLLEKYNYDFNKLSNNIVNYNLTNYNNHFFDIIEEDEFYLIFFDKLNWNALINVIKPTEAIIEKLCETNIDVKYLKYKFCSTPFSDSFVKTYADKLPILKLLSYNLISKEFFNSNFDICFNEIKHIVTNKLINDKDDKFFKIESIIDYCKQTNRENFETIFQFYNSFLVKNKKTCLPNFMLLVDIVEGILPFYPIDKENKSTAFAKIIDDIKKFNIINSTKQSKTIFKLYPEILNNFTNQFISGDIQVSEFRDIVNKFGKNSKLTEVKISLVLETIKNKITNSIDVFSCNEIQTSLIKYNKLSVKFIENNFENLNFNSSTILMVGIKYLNKVSTKFKNSVLLPKINDIIINRKFSNLDCILIKELVDKYPIHFSIKF